MNWSVEYNNDVGRNDEGFWEWYELQWAGTRVAKFDQEQHARGIAKILNEQGIKPTDL